MSETAQSVATDRLGGRVARFRPRPPIVGASRIGRARAAPIGANLLRAMARAFEERRMVVLVPPAIITGVIVATISPSAPDPLILSVAGAALLLGLLLTLRSVIAFRSVIVLASVWFGFSLLFSHGLLFGTQMLAWPAYGTYEVQVDEVISETDASKRVIVSEIASASNARPLAIRRARILVSTTAPLSPGDVIRAPIRFAPVPGPVVPGGFDTQFHAYFDGIGAYGNTTGPVELVRTGAPSAPARIVDGIRRAIGSRVDAVLQQPASGIARALITGDRNGVAEDAREMMAAAGLAHVLSISGLHLTLVAGGFFVALRMLLSVWDGLARRISVKRLAAAGGIVAALVYFSISGGQVAALRATVMILLVFGAVLVGRRALTMRNVAIAALVVVVTDPASILRPSFQLSFSAVVALIGAWELARSSEHKERGLVRQFVGYFGGLALTSVVAGAATLLFSIYHFQQTSPLGLLGNLATLPLVGFLMMPMAAIGTLLMPFGAEEPFLTIMGWSIDVMLAIARNVAEWSDGLGHSPILRPLALVLGLTALTWFAFLQSWHRLIGPLLLVPAVVLFALDRSPDVLVADTTQAVALRTDDELQLVQGKPNTFAVGVWRETYGEPIPAGLVSCDSVACVASSPKGFTVAFIRDPAGFYEECGRVDLIVTRLTAPNSCQAPAIVDADDLARGGVHWLGWDPGRGAFEIRPAISELNQPWRRAARR